MRVVSLASSTSFLVLFHHCLSIRSETDDVAGGSEKSIVTGCRALAGETEASIGDLAIDVLREVKIKQDQDGSIFMEVYQHHEHSLSPSLDASYILIGRIDFETGKTTMMESEYHGIGYAYQPVTSRLGEACDRDESATVEESYPRGWWQWWLPRWWSHLENIEFSGYERDDRAFAAGSHGSVWKARRNCPKGIVDSFCSQPLVLKQINLSAGYQLLEAGLRECYFGGILANLTGLENELFTRYEDHFFRQNGEILELWIVYRDAGVSLRGFLYSAIAVGDVVMYHNSWLWKQVRAQMTNSGAEQDLMHDPLSPVGEGVIKNILHQLLEAVAVLHDNGIVHRDIKPSNILCRSQFDMERYKVLDMSDAESIRCVLGDFSSAYDDVVANRFYTRGPTRKEQTDEYAPPEAIFGLAYDSPNELLSPAFDSWSVGVVALELLLGTPYVFSVDPRTRAILSHKLQRAGATDKDIEKAMYLAALSQFCIFSPRQDQWPLRSGDPLYNTSMTKASCTLYDFQHALRLRDPLAVGFETSELLLHLIWQLLTFDPAKRISSREALRHPFFTGASYNDEPGDKAVESQMLDPRMDFTVHDTPENFYCPKCGRVFHDWRSCLYHAHVRNHSKFCSYEKSLLPTCIGSHPMLPAHAFSGHCDIQGRRRTMEDFHSIRLDGSSSLYAILDGHNGNFASKYVSEYLRDRLFFQFPSFPTTGDLPSWKRKVKEVVVKSFQTVHNKLLNKSQQSPYASVQKSGTTVTLAYTTSHEIVVASLGDSRAISSSWSRRNTKNETLLHAVQLTKDHVASDADERKLVEARGGTVISVNGLDRVNGTLAITRSIGDASLAPLLSREPDVITLTMAEWSKMCGDRPKSIPCFLIIASDGLWDTITNQEAVDMVYEVILESTQDLQTGWKESSSLQLAAESLVLEAFVRGSSDNIGVYVISVPCF